MKLEIILYNETDFIHRYENVYSFECSDNKITIYYYGTGIDILSLINVSKFEIKTIV